MSKRVFITGGASGLGKSLALCCARAGFWVCICDTNNERGQEALLELQEAGSPEAIFQRCDVRSESDLIAVRDLLDKTWNGVDVVVNNAGVAQAGDVEDVPLEDWEWVIDINLLGVVRGCKVFTPLFKRQRGGHFINIASMAGLLDGPGMGAYSVTKAGVVKLSEVLDMELAPYQVKTTVVCPAFFPTNLGESLRSTNPDTDRFLQKAFARSPISADQVAQQIYEAILEPRFWILPHRREKYLWWLKSMVPHKTYRSIVSWLVQRYIAKGRKS